MSEKRIAICPGSFDPITLGHLNIIRRSAKIFDEVIVCVMLNATKTSPMFTIDERVGMVKRAVVRYPNVRVDTADVLLAEYARRYENAVIVKGLRAASDFDYEFQMNLINKKINPELETMFLTASEKYTFLSSSVVREMATYGADLTGLVPTELIPVEQGDVIELLDTLYSMISEAWGVPLGNDKCIIEREKALDLINEIKASMPSALAEAKRLVAARDEFIGNAKKEAESLRKSSEEKARSMIEEQEIIRIARTRSAEMISNAEAKSAELRRVAGDYVDDVMRQAEESLRNSLETIQSAHSAVRSANGTRPASAQTRREREPEEKDFISFQ